MERKFIIKDPLGIHARPASLLVVEAAKYESEITISKENKKGNLKSIMGVMALGVKNGEEITIFAVGSDEEQALQSLKDLMIKNKLI